MEEKAGGDGRGDLVFCGAAGSLGPLGVCARNNLWPGNARDLENPKPQPVESEAEELIANCTRAIVASHDSFQHPVICGQPGSLSHGLADTPVRRTRASRRPVPPAVRAIATESAMQPHFQTLDLANLPTARFHQLYL